jgi:hypothetical protein
MDRFRLELLFRSIKVTIILLLNDLLLCTVKSMNKHHDLDRREEDQSLHQLLEAGAGGPAGEQSLVVGGEGQK